jgi:hypothetical protein
LASSYPPSQFNLIQPEWSQEKTAACETGKTGTELKDSTPRADLIVMN